jgi:hypothetical protein
MPAPKGARRRASQTATVYTGNGLISLLLAASFGLLAAADVDSAANVQPASIVLVECSTDLVFETIPWSGNHAGADTARRQGRAIEFAWNPETGELSYDAAAPAFTFPEGLATGASVEMALRCE